jgi:hypothetical protein
MDQRLSWEANSYSPSQIPQLLCNLKVHHFVHNSPSLVPWTRRIQSIHSYPVPLRSVLILFSQRSLDLLCLFPLGHLSKFILWFLISPMHDMCPAHFIFLHLLTSIILYKEYTLWNFSVCSSIQLPVVSSILSQNIPLTVLLSDILNLCPFLNVRDKVSVAYKTRGIIC